MESTKGFLRDGFKSNRESNYKFRIGVMIDDCKNEELLVIR